MITISVITPTFNREDLLARCVESVLAQQVEDASVEHIVVNDYGSPLEKDAPWRNDPRTRVVDTFRTERSVARNTGAALSRGQWLYFLDDDDYVLPGAFAALLEVAARHPRAVKVYGGYQIVEQATGVAQTIRPELAGDASALFLAGEGLPPQATWLRRDAFFRAGCFDPLLSAAEDADLNRRVGLLGEVAGTSFVVAVVRINHAATTTTDYARHQRFFHAALEKSLHMPQTLGINILDAPPEFRSPSGTFGRRSHEREDYAPGLILTCENAPSWSECIKYISADCYSSLRPMQPRCSGASWRG